MEALEQKTGEEEGMISNDGGENPLSISKDNTSYAPMKKTKRATVQYRSNLHSVIQEITAIKFKKAHLEKLKKYSPFWSLCDLIISKAITKQICQKSDRDVKNIIKNFNHRKEAFYLGGQYLKITVQDIEHIFGISGGKEKIYLAKYKKESTSLFQRKFTSLKLLTKEHISVRLRAASSGTSEEDIDDVPKLVTLLLLVVLFVPIQGVRLGWGYMKYVDDLGQMKNYDWSGHVFEKLYSSLCFNDNPEKVVGCTMALPYWVMNNFSISNPMNKDALLLCQKWDLGDMTRATKFATIEEICLSTVEGASGSKKRLTPAFKRKTSGIGLRRDIKRAVSQSYENTQCCKKLRENVDKSSDSFGAWSSRAPESDKEKYPATSENESASIDKASTTLNSNDGAIQNDWGRETDFNGIEQSHIGPNFNSSLRRTELDKGTTEAMEAPGHEDITLVAQNTLRYSPSAYLARGNDLAAKDNAPRTTIPNTNGCLKENETEKADELNVDNSSMRRIKIAHDENVIVGTNITSEIPKGRRTTLVYLNNTLLVENSHPPPNLNSTSEKVESFRKRDLGVIAKSTKLERIEETCLSKQFQPKANISAATEKASTITNSNGWLAENESEKQRTSNKQSKHVLVNEGRIFIEIDDDSETENEVEKQQTLKKPHARFKDVWLFISQENVEVNIFDSSTIRTEIEKQRIPNEQSKHALVNKYRIAIEIDDDSEAEKEAENQPIIEEGVKPSQVISDLRIIFGGIDITSMILPHTRIPYFNLCHTQKTPLHRDLTKGIHLSHVVSIICQTVTISNAIKNCSISTPHEEIVYWGKALDSFSSLGMNVGFMCDRVKHILDIMTKVVDKKKAKAEWQRLEKKRRGFDLIFKEMLQKITAYEFEIEKTKENQKKIVDGMKETEELEAMLKLTASAPW